MPAPALSKIVGRVMVSDQPSADVRVQLKGSVERETQTDENGAFTFRDLPPGKYDLKSSGYHHNMFYEGKSSVTLPAPTDPAEVKIQAERK